MFCSKRSLKNPWWEYLHSFPGEGTFPLNLFAFLSFLSRCECKAWAHVTLKPHSSKNEDKGQGQWSEELKTRSLAVWLSPRKPALNCLWSCSYCNEQIGSHLLALLKSLSCGGVLSWGKHSSNRNNRWFHLPVLSVTICSAWGRSDFAFQSTYISLDCCESSF